MATGTRSIFKRDHNLFGVPYISRLKPSGMDLVDHRVIDCTGAGGGDLLAMLLYWGVRVKYMYLGESRGSFFRIDLTLFHPNICLQN